MSGSAVRPPAEFTAPVRGGELVGHHWEFESPNATPVIALHGITANGRAYDAVARALTTQRPGTDTDGPTGATGVSGVSGGGGDGGSGVEASVAARGRTTSLYAPDLRGRAGSAGLGGPYGLGAHVDDLCALLDHWEQPKAVLLGHSMGAFVAALAAARHPDRFPYVVLVDGGLGFPPPAGADTDAQLDAVLGPAMRRLSMTFASPQAYRDFFREHPALAAHWGPDIESYVDRDLVGEAGALRSSCVVDAVRADGAEVLTHAETLAAVHQPQVRGTLLWAERGLLDEPQALYDPQRIAAADLDPERLPNQRVDGTNHYSVLFAEDAVQTVASHVRRALRRVGP